MPTYAFTFYGEPKFQSREEGANYKEKWMAWAASLGNAWVNSGAPLGKPKIVSSSGVSEGDGSNRLTGFSIVKADSLDAARDMVKGCPHREHGTVNVAEVMEMRMM
jgi:hypothetical protein